MSDIGAEASLRRFNYSAIQLHMESRLIPRFRHAAFALAFRVYSRRWPGALMTLITREVSRR